jgi:hypothetical protein
MEARVGTEDFERKLGQLMVQIVGFERMVADLTQQNATLMAELATLRHQPETGDRPPFPHAVSG